MQLVKKMARIGVESAFDVLVKARALEAQGKNVIHLEIGEPDFPTPRNVIEAGKKALDEGWTKYGPTQACRNCDNPSPATFRARGIKVGPQNVCVVPGGQ
jgi:aspartate/methionine/tyrosine aminotransferase